RARKGLRDAVEDSVLKRGNRAAEIQAERVAHEIRRPDPDAEVEVQRPAERLPVCLHRLLAEDRVHRIAGDEVEEDRAGEQRYGRGEQGARDLAQHPVHCTLQACARLRRLPCGSTRIPRTLRETTPMDSSCRRGRAGRSWATMCCART